LSLVHRFDDDAISVKGKGAIEEMRWVVNEAKSNVYNLRLAAIVHDIGHSLFSHTSERIYSMLSPFPELVKALEIDIFKRPGAAEIISYLIVTSDEWVDAIENLWNECKKKGCNPPELTKDDWYKIGNWILGYEKEPRRKFFAEIISGPLDADKLDYIARDAYFSGIPVGHDYERYVNLVCIDYQNKWWRLTLPKKGINALEQLVMARLALTSYVYHHQKIRSAESWFERLLAKEIKENKQYFGKKNVWELFKMEDAELYLRASIDNSSDWHKLHYRQIPVRYLEFRLSDLLNGDKEIAQQGYGKLLDWTNEGDWGLYNQLLDIEKIIADSIGIDTPGIIIDVPRTPSYADIENLELPGTAPEATMPAQEAIIYKDWIDAYKVHRAYVRIFAHRGLDNNTVFQRVKEKLADIGLELQESNQVLKSK
jgi:HD superfamily phosphohydrolase